MAQLEKMVQKEINITASWENEVLKITTAHIKKHGWQNIELLKKTIADRIPKFAMESLKLGVNWIDKNGEI